MKKKNLVIGKKEARATCKIVKLKERYKEFRDEKDEGGTLPPNGGRVPTHDGGALRALYPQCRVPTPLKKGVECHPPPPL